VGSERIVKQSESALMKYDPTFPIGLAALSGHLVVCSIRSLTRRWGEAGESDEYIDRYMRTLPEMIKKEV
jgi:hypothetical protein